MTVIGSGSGVLVGRRRIIIGNMLTSRVLYPCLGCPANLWDIDQDPATIWTAPTYAIGGIHASGSNIRYGLSWDGTYLYYTSENPAGVSTSKNEIRKEAYPSGTYTTIYTPGGTNQKFSAESPTLDGSGNVWFVEWKTSTGNPNPAGLAAEIKKVPTSGGAATVVVTINKILNDDNRVGAIVWNPYNGYLYWVHIFRTTTAGGAAANYQMDMVVMDTGGSTVATYTTLVGSLTDPNQIQLAALRPLAVDSAGTVWAACVGKDPTGKSSVAVGFKLDGSIVYADGRPPGQAFASFAPVLIPLPNNMSYFDETYTLSGVTYGPVATEAKGIILRELTIGSTAGWSWADQNGNCWWSPCRGTMPASGSSWFRGAFAFMPDHSKVLHDMTISGVKWWAEIPC